MLREIKELKSYTLGARDGEIGKVEEFYFDDRSWTVRYLVADTGNWIPVNLTRTQIENSPALESHVPVSRQFEMKYFPYYSLLPYWEGPMMSGTDAYTFPNALSWPDATRLKEDDDPHLRSTRDVMGHAIQADDGELGHVEDFVLDDDRWVIRYFIVDLRNWWPGKKVLISTRWIQRISWEESKVFINLSREAIKRGPEYTPGILIERDYEARLHRNHNLQGYWVDDLTSIAAK